MSFSEKIQHIFVCLLQVFFKGLFILQTSTNTTKPKLSHPQALSSKRLQKSQQFKKSTTTNSSSKFRWSFLSCDDECLLIYLELIRLDGLLSFLTFSQLWTGDDGSKWFCKHMHLFICVANKNIEIWSVIITFQSLCEQILFVSKCRSWSCVRLSLTISGVPLIPH